MSVSSRSNRSAQRCPGGRVDELRGDPDPASGLADATLEHVAHAEALADLADIDVLALEREGRVAGDDEELRELRQRGDDVLGNAVGEILLFGIAAHVGERQHGDRRTGGFDRRGRGGAGRAPGVRRPDRDGVNAHRPGDVLQRLLAAIDEGLLHAVAHLPPGVLRQADPARLGDAFDPGRDVDAVAHQVAVGLLDHVAEMNADAELDALVRRDAGIAVDQAILHLDRAAHRVDHAAELDDEPVAGALDDAAVMHGDRRVGEVAAQKAQTRKYALLVGAGETAEADDIGGEDGGDFSGLVHGASGAGRR
jgi:hypothetical protein